MTLLFAAILVAMNPGPSSPSDGSPGICVGPRISPDQAILRKESTSEDRTRQDCLSEDSQENEGEEEDGDSTSLWGFAFRPPFLIGHGPLPCEVVALRQILVGVDRDSRSALLRC